VRKVLVIDDDLAFHELVASLLEPSDFEVLCTEGAREASAAVARGRFDLYVVDSLLPDGDGVAWIRDARARGDVTPAVLLSASPAQVTMAGRLAHGLGIALVLAKPIMAEVFREQIAAALNGHAREDVAPPAAESASGDSDAGLAAIMEQLREEYRRELPRKLEVLAHAVDLVRELEADPIALAAARSDAHRLRGTAGSYGFIAIGQAAGRIEDALVRLPDEGATGRARMLGEIEAALDDALRGLDETAAPRARSTGAARPPIWRVLAVDDDRDFLAHLVDIGTRAGVSVVTAGTAAEALSLARTVRFDAALVDVNLAPPDVSWVLALDLRIERPDLPFAFLSAESAVETRIAAVHAGAALYLEKPIDEERLRDSVGMLVRTTETARTRVLLLDDDPYLRAHASVVLGVGGVQVRAIGDPSELIEALESMHPDALLLDVMLDGSSGFDVCRMLRAMPRWRELPIIFITASADDPAMRIAAFEAGGDDWVQKPFVEAELVARVRARAERARARSDARDALTGLPLRGAGCDVLTARLAECLRGDAPLAVALIDLDGLRRVNEAHGHQVGDRVLGQIGAVIARRFRPEDVRMRWAGDEFLVGFPKLEVGTATGAVVKLKKELEATVFKGEGALTLRLTFSAGLASFPRDGRRLDDLVAKAEERLAQAKHAGGSTVIAS
jgi:diguanylate cyclase (GGDEF)-like protein